MFSARNWARALVAVVPLLIGGNALGDVIDDEVPEVTARVARISYIAGEAQVLRSGTSDWEKAVMNLPLVEGDELATSEDARLEIQFDSRTFIRIEENTIVRVVTLKDEGIALSVPEGSISLRLDEFDKEKTFLEIDIPNITLAVQRAGLYRIDPGSRNSAQARVRVTDGGEVRVYSDTSGFTLKNGRLATIYLSGANAGEWDTADASLFSDEFDTWTLDRDAVLAKRLRDANYDRYYDRDIYGAEDLSDHGDWIYTRKYGYVWRPFRTSLAGYSDWSPYRYGHWRWFAPFGWTWINDEPWGWATYHYGRWLWDSGYWYWSPYGYYRYRRSWWQPALVVITAYNNNICWYPLPYYYRHYNYNWAYHHGRYGGRNWPVRTNDNPPTTGGQTNQPTGRGPVVGMSNEERRRRALTPPLSNVPPGGVVTMPADQYGRNVIGAKRAPLEVAKTILAKIPDENQSPPLLPQFEKVSRQVSKEIRAETPPIIARVGSLVRTGAGERKSGQPMDEDLRKSRMFGNRKPLVIQNPPPPMETVPTSPTTRDEPTPRKTGAVDRPVFKPREQPVETQTGPPIIPQTRREERKANPMPQRQEQPTFETPRRQQKSEPLPREEAPRYEPPRRQPPPVVVPPTRQQPPPQKSEPAPQPRREKPASPPLETRSDQKKDGI